MYIFSQHINQSVGPHDVRCPLVFSRPAAFFLDCIDHFRLTGNLCGSYHGLQIHTEYTQNIISWHPRHQLNPFLDFTVPSLLSGLTLQLICSRRASSWWTVSCGLSLVDHKVRPLIWGFSSLGMMRSPSPLLLGYIAHMWERIILMIWAWEHVNELCDWIMKCGCHEYDNVWSFGCESMNGI